MRAAVDEDDLGPQGGEDGGELATDGAATDHDEAAERTVEQRGAVGVEDIGVVERDAGREEGP